MRYYILGFLILSTTIFNVKAQAINQNKLPATLKQQASKMGIAFISGDYKVFANYTYPLILKSMGGASKMAALLTKTTDDIKAQGMSFNVITFDEPSKIIKSGKELQATIAQHTEIKLP